MEHGSYTIAPLGADHLAAVAALEAACFPTPWSPEQLAQELEAPGGLQLALLRNGALHGYALLRCTAGEAELLRIATDPALRRAGLGRQLLEASLEAVRRAGCALMFLEVREGSAAARSLYRSAGFEEIGRRPRYYHEPVEDAILMRTAIVPSG